MAKKSKTEGEAGAEGAAPAKSSKKMLMFAAIGLVVLGGVGGGAWFMMRKKPDMQVDAAGKPAVKKQIAFVELKEMMVNLAQTQGQERQNFLKLKIALEVGDPKAATEIQPLVPRIEDTFQVYMRELRAGELEGSAAVYRLKEELLKRVNLAVYPAKVEAVLFKEILMQ
jgi:flagellar protein FliL